MPPTEKEFQTYLFSYRHDGKEWGFDVKATSPEDAKARVSQMTFSRYEGVLRASFAVPSKGGWFRRLLQAARVL